MEEKDEDVITTLDRFYKVLKAEVKLLDKHLFKMTSEEYMTKKGQSLREQTNNLYMAQINLGLAVEYMRRADFYGQITAKADKKEI